jgi:hypothetical protein
MVSFPQTYDSEVWNMSEQPEWVTVKQAAEIMGIHIESVRRLCRNGTIECKQFVEDVSDWQVSYQSAIAYRKKVGRPRKNAS